MNRAELLESSATSQSRRCPSCRSDRLADFFESRFAPVRVGSWQKAGKRPCAHRSARSFWRIA